MGRFALIPLVLLYLGTSQSLSTTGSAIPWTFKWDSTTRFTTTAGRPTTRFATTAGRPTTRFVENPPTTASTRFVENPTTTQTTRFVGQPIKKSTTPRRASKSPTIPPTTGPAAFTGTAPATPTPPPARVDGLEMGFDHASIVPGITDHLTLTCSMQMALRADFVSLISLVILKLNPRSRQYQELAILSGFRPDAPTSMSGSGSKLVPELSGQVDHNGLSHLTIEWSYPDKDLPGRYLCESNVFTSSGHTEKLTVAADLAIGTVDLSYVLNMLRGLQDKVRGLEQKCTCLEAGTDDNGNTTSGNDVIGSTSNQSPTDRLLVPDFRNPDNETVTNQNEVHDLENRILELEANVGNLTQTTLKLNRAIKLLGIHLKGLGVLYRTQTEKNRDLTKMLFHDTDVDASGQRFYYSYISFNSFSEAQAACSNLGGLLVELEQSELRNVSVSFKKIQNVYTGNSYIGVVRNGSEPWSFSSTGLPTNYQLDLSTTFGDCLTFDLSSDSFMSVSCEQGMSKALCGVSTLLDDGIQ